MLLARCADKFPRMRRVWADQRYRGLDFLVWVREETGIAIQIVQRKDGGFRGTWAKADAPPRVVPMFPVVPRRCVIERSFAWLSRYQRLSKNYEYLAASQANAIYLATIMLLLHRTARPVPCTGLHRHLLVQVLAPGGLIGRFPPGVAVISLPSVAPATVLSG
ncbi:transposase [Streptomyces sp. NPDC050610]|uniref:transposase n=1 Tax=Streptomyces sp. NPDC050610 TaxID=3157097 RepID=UPI00342E601C